MKRYEAMPTDANKWDEGKLRDLDAVLTEMEMAKLEIPCLGYAEDEKESLLDIRIAINYGLQVSEEAVEERRQQVIDKIAAEVAEKFKDCAQAMDDQGVQSLLVEVNQGLALLGREIAQVMIDGREIRPDGLQDTKVLDMTNKESRITIRQVGKATVAVTAGIIATGGLTQQAAAAERPNTFGVVSSVIDEGQEQTNRLTTDTVDTPISQPTIAIEDEEQPTSAALVDESPAEVNPTPDQAVKIEAYSPSVQNIFDKLISLADNPDYTDQKASILTEIDVLKALLLDSEVSTKFAANVLENDTIQSKLTKTIGADNNLNEVLDSWAISIFGDPNYPDNSYEESQRRAFVALLITYNFEVGNIDTARDAKKTINFGSEANQEKLAPHWDQKSLEKVAEYIAFYKKSAKKYNIPWELLAVLHYRETALSRTNPSNGQGIFQLYSSRDAFAAKMKTSDAEFQRQCDLAAKFVKEKSKIGQVKEKLKGTGNSDAKIKDILFSYNGRAESYKKQAEEMGYSLDADGSPYVMNLADSKRNASKNPDWGQIITDHGKIQRANAQPGAFILYKELILLQSKPPITPKHTKPVPHTLTNTGVRVPIEMGGVKMYSQWDQRWANYKYSIKKDPKAAAKQTMASSGCAPAVVAMVASTQMDKNITPLHAAGALIKKGGRTLDSGTKRDVVIEVLEETYKLNASYVSKDPSAIKDGLKKGALYIVAGRDSNPSTPLTSSGHYILIRGIAKNGEFLINDPNSVSKSKVSWSAEELLTKNGAVIKVTNN